MGLKRRRWRRVLTDRSGMTVLEVLLALAIFLIGSVSIIGLFAAASVLHADAVGRRTAGFVAQELLAQVQTMRMRDVYAKTTLAEDVGAGDTEIQVNSVTATMAEQAANFDECPVVASIAPVQTGLADPIARTTGPVLIGNEWIWYPALQLPNTLGNDPAGEPLRRPMWGTTSPDAGHAADDTVLQPRTWYYVVDDQDPINTPPNMPSDGEGWDPLPASGVVRIWVAGNPIHVGGLMPPLYDGDFSAPEQGYLVIDEEWFRYEATGFDPDRIPPWGQGWFQISQTDGEPDRGWGGTEAVAHSCGSPVTIAREHPYYPGFYYTVQFYPVNTTGLQAQVVVSVGYRTGALFRVWTFRSLFTPTIF